MMTRHTSPTTVACDSLTRKKVIDLELKLNSFFLPMVPPTITHQEHSIHVVKKGSRHVPVVYEPDELKEARAKLLAHLCRHMPDAPAAGPIRLITRWCFPAGKHQDGSYKVTKPDTDNLQKLFKDCMTHCGFWKDDAQVASELTEKFWADVPGIYVEIYALEVDS